MNQRKVFGIALLLVVSLLAGSLFAFAGVVYAFDPDTDLSNADASFWGEDSNDDSGDSVACAGDVNGDGLDDFLIGAPGDDDGGDGAGQTYLILGRATADWGMDSDLSNADASFWGEDSYDQSGESVACAGDVNGDGRDDFLIGAPGDEDGGAYGAGQTYLSTAMAALTSSSVHGKMMTAALMLVRPISSWGVLLPTGGWTSTCQMPMPHSGVRMVVTTLVGQLPLPGMSMAMAAMTSSSVPTVMMTAALVLVRPI